MQPLPLKHRLLHLTCYGYDKTEQATMLSRRQATAADDDAVAGWGTFCFGSAVDYVVQRAEQLQAALENVGPHCGLVVHLMNMHQLWTMEDWWSEVLQVLEAAVQEAEANGGPLIRSAIVNFIGTAVEFSAAVDHWQMDYICTRKSKVKNTFVLKWAAVQRLTSLFGMHVSGAAIALMKAFADMVNSSPVSEPPCIPAPQPPPPVPSSVPEPPSLSAEGALDTHVMLPAPAPLPPPPQSV